MPKNLSSGGCAYQVLKMSVRTMADFSLDFHGLSRTQAHFRVFSRIFEELFSSIVIFRDFHGQTITVVGSRKKDESKTAIAESGLPPLGPAIVHYTAIIATILFKSNIKSYSTKLVKAQLFFQLVHYSSFLVGPV